MADILHSNLQIQPMQGRDRVRYKFRLGLRAALKSNRFDRFLTLTILLYAGIIAALSYLELNPKNHSGLIRVLHIMDFSIFTSFCAEMCLKIYAFRGKFFRNGVELL